MKVKLELYYLPFNFASLEDGFDKNEILELIESSLHYHYRPILGRSEDTNGSRISKISKLSQNLTSLIKWKIRS